jgi:UDP-N-acetylglucosamine 3-dehydrogenase
MIKVGVIGLGAMGKNHVRVYSEMPGVELVGIADKDNDLANTMAEKFNTTPFDNYKELLKKKLDAVSIVVPTSLHSKLAVEATRAGVNVLVEKPIAGTLDEAEEIITAARDNNVKLMVGHIERFNPAVSIIKREIADCKVDLVEITRIGPFPPRIKDVGVVIDSAIHDIDLIRYLTGSEFKKAYSLTSKNESKHEDVALLIFEMANGVLARVTVNWLTPFKLREIRVPTDKKFLRAALIEQKVTEYRSCQDNGTYMVKEINTPYSEPLKLELEAFIKSVRDGTNPPISGEDGLSALKVALKCINKSYSSLE